MAAKVDAAKCTACGACVDVCPVEAIKVDKVAVVDDGQCADCGQCVDECPSKALSV
jgi:ferredoxin